MRDVSSYDFFYLRLLLSRCHMIYVLAEFLRNKSEAACNNLLAIYYELAISGLGYFSLCNPFKEHSRPVTHCLAEDINHRKKLYSKIE